MVVALLALSLVMILGGVAAVVQGFPYVRLESGLAMVIGGSTAASAGVILLGLTAVVDRLRRLQGALGRLRSDARDADAAPWQAPPAPVEVAPTAAPALAGAARLAGLGLGGLGAARAGGRGTEPVFEEPVFRDAAPGEPVPESRREIEPLLPDLLPESPPPRPDDDSLFAPAPAPAEPVAEPAAVPPPEPPVAEAIGLRPSLDAPASAPEPAPETAAPVPVPEEPPVPERHAVGSYASGANTYVMFSDGSIEADTPRGRYTFGSLDELKSFVNAGGEEARGAA